MADQRTDTEINSMIFKLNFSIEDPKNSEKIEKFKVGIKVLENRLDMYQIDEMFDPEGTGKELPRELDILCIYALTVGEWMNGSDNEEDLFK